MDRTKVDNYKNNGISINVTLLKGAFKNNATRVTISQNTYQIPVIYDRGFIYYRVRAVGVEANNYEQPIKGQWKGVTITEPFFLSA